MSIIVKKGNTKTVVPIWSSEVGLVDINNNFEGKKNVEEALQLLKSNTEQLSNSNISINGGFQIWQRGENQIVSSALTAYCADRWRVHQTNILQSKQLTNDNRLSKYCLRVENKGDTASQLYLTQPFEHDTIDYLTDKTLTLSFWIKGYNGAENTLYYEIGNKQIGAFTLTNDWQKITGSVKAQFVKDNINLRGVTIFTSSSNLIVKDTGFYISDVKLELGPVATPFVPRPYGEELSLCQRYYQICRVPTQTVMGDTNGQLQLTIPVCTPMRIDTPTIASKHDGIWLHPSTGGKAIEFSGQYLSNIRVDYQMLRLENIGNPQIVNKTIYSVNQSNADDNISSGVAVISLDTEIY